MAKARESASIVGISGVGKSNLFNHLLDPKTLSHYLKDEAQNYIFVRVNFHYIPDFSTRSIYSVILDGLENVGEQNEILEIDEETFQTVGKYHDDLLEAGEDLLKVQRQFRKVIKLFLSDSDRRIIFLFDQFDEVFSEAHPRTLANLRGLREAYKYRIMFFVFTREILPGLMAIDSEREEFYELLSSNVIGLKPYTPRDSRSLLERLAARYETQLSESLADALIQISGGHAGLLRAAYLYILDQGIDPTNVENLPTLLLEQQSVQVQCQSVWQSIGIEEQRLMSFLANNLSIEQFAPAVIKTLQIKGALLGQKIFSPIIEAYVKAQGKLWEQSIYFDGRNKRLWISDKAIKLTPIEFRLFKAFYDKKDQIISNNELSDAGWPDAEGAVSDEMIVTNIRRLRHKIEPNPKNPQYIINVRGEGYKLQI